MHSSQTTISTSGDTSAAVMLGGVLGLILGGALVTGFYGWKLWALNAPATAAMGVDNSGTRAPSPFSPSASYQSSSSGYAAPAVSMDQTSAGYNSYYSAPMAYGAAQPSGDDTWTSSSPQPAAPSTPHDSWEFGTPYSSPKEAQITTWPPDPATPVVSDEIQAEKDLR